MLYMVYVMFKSDPDPEWFPYSGIEHDFKETAINEAAEALSNPSISKAKIEEYAWTNENENT